MSDSVPAAEGEPISGVGSGWLWAVRCFALICTLIEVGKVFHEFPRLGAEFEFADGKMYFAALIPYLAALCFLFRRGKNPLAFALGMATVTGFLGGGLGLLGLGTLRDTFLPILTLFWIFVLLWDLSAWLFWPFFISTMMLGLSAYEAFAKMRSGAKGTQGIAFRRGMFTAVLVWLLSSVVAIFVALATIHM
jgi:hypothetical protein